MSTEDEAAKHVLRRVETGVPGLDTVLNGGFLEGGLYIVQGAPGTGKTIMGNQICFHMVRQGMKALYVTLLAEYHARLIQHLEIMSFFDGTKIPEFLSYLNGLPVLHQDGLKGLLDLLRREITGRGIRLLVLDGIVSAQGAVDRGEEFNEFVHQLQGIALSTDCTVLMLTSAKGVRLTPEHTMVDGIIELSDETTGWAARSILQVAKLRGSAYLRGRHSFKITDDGIRVFPRIEAVLARPSRQDPRASGHLRTGIAVLDRMLDGGLPAASTAMVIGPTGIGKTTLGLHFLAGCTEDEPGLFFGFYETPERVRAKADVLCRPLSGLLDDGTVELLWQPPTFGLLDEYGAQLLAAVHRRGVKRLFIDGMSALCKAADPGRSGHFLIALMNEMRVLGVTTVYTLEVPNITGPMITAGVSDLSGLAENLILMRFVELRARTHRLISVLKTRDKEFAHSLHEFRITGDGLDIAPESDSAEALMADFYASRQTQEPADAELRYFERDS